MQVISTAVETKQQLDSREDLAPVMVQHHHSTGYSVAVGEQRSGSVSPSRLYYPQRRNVEQEPLRQSIPQMVSMLEDEVGKVEHTDPFIHTTEHVLDPTAKCSEPIRTCKEPPPLSPQPSVYVKLWGRMAKHSSFYG